jgi:hypothetical protein
VTLFCVEKKNVFSVKIRSLVEFEDISRYACQFNTSALIHGSTLQQYAHTSPDWCTHSHAKHQKLWRLHWTPGATNLRVQNQTFLFGIESSVVMVFLPWIAPVRARACLQLAPSWHHRTAEPKLPSQNYDFEPIDNRQHHDRHDAERSQAEVWPHPWP